MNDLIIANCISTAAAVCTCLSSLSKTKSRIYYFQVAQCLLLTIASFFFHSYAGIATLLLCSIRNYLLAIDKYNKYLCFILAAGTLILGAIFNNNGIIGWIIIIANVIYTLGGYIAHTELTIKINILIDLLLWIIYELLIYDFPSLIADTIGAGITIYAIVRARSHRERD